MLLFLGMRIRETTNQLLLDLNSSVIDFLFKIKWVFCPIVTTDSGLS